jgi:hypothetical protein
MLSLLLSSSLPGARHAMRLTPPPRSEAVTATPINSVAVTWSTCACRALSRRLSMWLECDQLSAIEAIEALLAEEIPSARAVGSRRQRRSYHLNRLSPFR